MWKDGLLSSFLHTAIGRVPRPFFFEKFGRTKDWHLGELKMASRRTHRRIITQFFPTRSQEKYKLRELVRRIINPRELSQENYNFFQLGLRRNTS